MNMSLAFLRFVLPCLLILPTISFAQAIPSEEEIQQSYFANLPNEVIERNLKAFWDCSWAGPDDNFSGNGVCTWNNSPDRKLAQRRIQMRKTNLFSGYVNDKYPTREKPCSEEEKKWRTADGSCNYETQDKAYAGSAGARFGRLSKPDSAQPETGDRLLTPNPRRISLDVLTRKDFKAVPFLNLFATAWIQFMIHDWFDHGEPDNDMSKAIPLAVDQDDPWNKEFKLQWNDEKKTYVTLVPRTRQDLSADDNALLAKLVPETPLDGKGAPRNQYKVHQNVVTAWWDLGQVYGNDEATQKQLRSGVGGKLRVREDGLLPLKEYRHNGRPTYTEESGFTKNWWVGLSLLHHLFVREHNYIAEQLAINPETRRKKGESEADFDKRTFQIARLINSAVMAKIHTNEWTPAILANPTMYWGMNGNWYGYKRDCGKAENFTEKFYRIFDPMLLRFDKREIMGATGRVGEKMQDYGTTYTFPEEFVSVYRMHPLLPDQFTVRNYYSGQVSEKIPIAKLRDGDTTKLIYGDDYKNPKHSMMDLMYSMGQERPGQLVADNYPNVLQNIALPVRNPNNPKGYEILPMDLASIDILRDRERGVPRYNQFRRNLHLRPIPDFRWLSNDKDLVARLRKAYNNNIEDLDLFVGAMAESYRPAGFGFAETLFQLFVLTASRRLETDKFFTSHFNEKYYTKFGMDYINGVNSCDQGRTMSSIIKTHFPQLGNALQGVLNPFRPWNDASKGASK